MSGTTSTFALGGAQWRRVKGATSSQIAQFRSSLPAVELPAKYIELLQFTNGGEGELALPPLWLQLYETTYVIELWSDPHYRTEYPTLLFFGSNGGLESIAFEMKHGHPWPIVMVDCVAGLESSQTIAPSIEKFIEAIGVEGSDEA